MYMSLAHMQRAILIFKPLRILAEHCIQASVMGIFTHFPYIQRHVHATQWRDIMTYQKSMCNWRHILIFPLTRIYQVLTPIFFTYMSTINVGLTGINAGCVCLWNNKEKKSQRPDLYGYQPRNDVYNLNPKSHHDEEREQG